MGGSAEKVFSRRAAEPFFDDCRMPSGDEVHFAKLKLRGPHHQAAKKQALRMIDQTQMEASAPDQKEELNRIAEKAAVASKAKDSGSRAPVVKSMEEMTNRSLDQAAEAIETIAYMNFHEVFVETHGGASPREELEAGFPATRSNLRLFLRDEYLANRDDSIPGWDARINRALAWLEWEDEAAKGVYGPKAARLSWKEIKIAAEHSLLHPCKECGARFYDECVNTMKPAKETSQLCTTCASKSVRRTDPRTQSEQHS